MHKGCYQKTFSRNEKDKIEKYIDLALTFNKTHNLFVRKNKTEIFNKDIIDCSPIITAIKPNNTVFDLGSGGGLPGILLSITKPKNKITLIESSQKKCYFLRSVVHKLELKNTTILNETLTDKNKLGKFDIVTARAFAPIEKILRLTKNNINKKGEYALLKGKNKKIEEELKFLDTKKYRYEIINLDNKNHQRNMVLITKNE